LWRGHQQPSSAIPSGEATRSTGLGSSPSDESSRARQDNADLGVLAGLAVDLYRSGMLLDNNVVSYRQAKASSLSGWFGREEGVEHPD
jgi:hypothetical protein